MKILLVLFFAFSCTGCFHRYEVVYSRTCHRQVTRADGLDIATPWNCTTARNMMEY